MELLERFGIADRIKHHPAELSGGEQQRAAIARALVKSPRLLLADEPTGNLDSVSGEKILELFAQLRDEGLPVVMITHNSEAAARADNVVRLVDGEIKTPETYAE
jgi:putative ABC transport system ATP-binding protein